MEAFRQTTADAARLSPVLVLVDERGHDPQLSYIVNPPDYSGPVLVCRHPQTDQEIAELQTAFPDRRLLRFDPKTFRLLQAPAADTVPSTRP